MNDPNRPNTNPAIAIAAINVIAIKITVARTGLIAFLLLGLLILNVGLLFYDQTPENGTDAPLPMLNEPTACEPTAGSAPATVQVTPVVVVPALTVVGLGAKAPAFAEPPRLIEQALIAVFEVPELVRLTVQTTLAPDTVQLVT